MRDKQLQAVRWDLLRHSDLNYFNRPVRTRMPGGVGGARSILAAPYPDKAKMPLKNYGKRIFVRSRVIRSLVAFLPKLTTRDQPQVDDAA